MTELDHKYLISIMGQLELFTPLNDAIREELAAHCMHYNNNAMAMLTLLRVWPYSSESDKKWLAEQLDKLWKQR